MCSPIVRETWVRSQVASYQRLLKWYLIPPCLTLSNIRYVSRVKWSNPGKGIAPSPTPRCSSYGKRAFGSPSTTVADFTSLYNYNKRVKIVIAKNVQILIFVLVLNTFWSGYGSKSQILKFKQCQIHHKVQGTLG